MKDRLEQQEKSYPVNQQIEDNTAYRIKRI